LTRSAGVIGLLCFAVLAAGCSRSVSEQGAGAPGVTGEDAWRDTVEEVNGMMVAQPGPTEEVLINPGTGWQMLVHRGPEGEMDDTPLVSTYYYRACWTEFEPERGKYEDSPAVRVIDEWLKEAAQRGRYVGIRMVPWNSGNPSYQRDVAQQVQGYDSAVPAYVFEDGARGFAEPGRSNGWVPVFWDPIYLQHHRELVRFLGQRYAGHPNLAYVDISAGNYGEMNLTNTGIQEFDDFSIWRENGFTPEAWGAMLRELYDMYREAFPDDLLVAARDYAYVDGGREQLPYLVEHGVGLRDDGLGMGYCSPGRTNPEYEAHWPEVLCLYENGGGSWLDWGNERGVRNMLDWAMDRTHASIVMVGKGRMGARAYHEFEPAVQQYGQRLGYRLVVEEASWPVSVSPGEELAVSLTWGNLGNAPPYRDFMLELSLLTEEGEVVCSEAVELSDPPTTDWLPAAQIPVSVALTVPAELAAGRYQVAISLFEPRGASAGEASQEVRRRIRLGIRGEDAETRYALGPVTVE